ncbi:TadE/TadG family type IV pilus assembly protein [Adhaeretor mobilis]|uniref:TadE-like protein n=1 Tax=Adhaeretor mobilis TaxID=1930276 RepID=A0A517MTC4_9BACT|nr:TadE/TadG family type IV pilus assembly protein [Adhaeretor mobilis]QDS98133.1 TadE-like protein [Adhaeretor mobilis]
MNTRSQHSKFTRSNCRGVTTVEFALTAPILFLMVFGGIELSRANMLMHTSSIAAMAAARQGIVPGATNAECVAAAQAELDIVGITSFNLEVNPTVMDNGTTQVIANLTVPVNGKNGYFLPQFFVGRSIFKTVTLQREGKHDAIDNETEQSASDPEDAYDGESGYYNNSGHAGNGEESEGENEEDENLGNYGNYHGSGDGSENSDSGNSGSGNSGSGNSGSGNNGNHYGHGNGNSGHGHGNSGH